MCIGLFFPFTDLVDHNGKHFTVAVRSEHIIPFGIIDWKSDFRQDCKQNLASPNTSNIATIDSSPLKFVKKLNQFCNDTVSWFWRQFEDGSTSPMGGMLAQT